MNFKIVHRIVAVLAVLAIGATGAVFAQDTGNLYGTVTDTEGAPLPGVTVTMTGYGADRTQITDAQGDYRFLGLDPGGYYVKAALEGFSTVEYPNVVININRNTEILITLSAAIEEVITVTSESPLLDERKITSGTTISQVELEKIPSARDPWVTMTQASGVMLDRVNVGGNESGQQSSFLGAGTSQNTNTYYIDGAEVTDRSAAGSSPTYYDFDQFAEFQLQTGGSDVTRDTPGVTLNLVTKRGSNEFRGSARFMLTNADGFFGALDQGNTDVPDNFLGPGQTDFTATQVERVEDYGFEAGGPLWRDKVWIWASWGNYDISQITAIGTTDRTILENTAVKLNAQFSSANSFVGSFNNGDKRKFGRGAASNRGPDSLWNQRGPTGISKFEDTHVFGSNFFLSGQYVFVDGGFSLASTGGCGPDGLEPFVGPDGIFHGRQCGSASRPSEEFKIDGTYFANTGNLNHEIKFGGRIREATTSSDWAYPGRDIIQYDGGYQGVRNAANLALFGLPPSRMDDLNFLYAYRQGPTPSNVNYNSLWVQDTLTWSKWTVNVGLRWDQSDGDNEAGTVDANPGFPTVMPPVAFGGNDAGGIDWTSIQPRVGVTYALGQERKTLLRGSLGQFADPMFLGHITRMNPVGGQIASILWVDNPGGNTGIYDDGEDFRTIGGLFGFDPANPAAIEVSNENDPNMDPPITTELIIGAEHAFLPEFVVGLQYTYRQTTDIPDLRELATNSAGDVVVVGNADYVNAAPITFNFPGESQVYSYTPQRFRDGLTTNGGWLLTSGDRERTYSGISLNFTKRLANQWMLRGYVQWSEGEWDIPGSYFTNNDPNIQNPALQENDLASDASTDGALFVEQSTGGGKNDTWMQASWSYNLNGMYQFAPDRAYGFNVAANIYGRQGFPITYFVNVNPGDGINRSIAATEVAKGSIDAFRTDTLFIFDLRLEKEFRTTGNTSFTFSIDAFNILDEDAVVSRSSRNLNAGSAGWLNETLAPRVWRLGVRLNWR
jgi:hypothetical protein